MTLPSRTRRLIELVTAPVAVVVVDALLTGPGDGNHQDELLAVLVALLAVATVRHLDERRPFANYLVATIPFAVVVARFLYTSGFPVRDSRAYLFPVFEHVGLEFAEGRFFSPWFLESGGVRLGVLHINCLAATPHRIPGYLLLALTPISAVSAYKVSLVFGAWLIGLGWNLVLRELVPHLHAVYVGTLMVLLGGTCITFHQEQTLATAELFPWFVLTLLHARRHRAWFVATAAILGLGTAQHYPQMHAIMLGSAMLVAVVLASTGNAGPIAPRTVPRLPLFLASAFVFALGTLPAIYIVTRLPTLASELRRGSSFAATSYEEYVRLFRSGEGSAPLWQLRHYVDPVVDLWDGSMDRCGFFVGRIGLLAAFVSLTALAISLACRLAGVSGPGGRFCAIAPPVVVARTSAFAAFFVLATGATIGVHGPLPRVLLALHVPLIGAFRQWYHFFPWMNFALSALGSVAVWQSAVRVAALAPDRRRMVVLAATVLLGAQTADLALSARRYCDRMCPPFAPIPRLAGFLARGPIGATRVFELRPAYDLHRARGSEALWGRPFVASRRVHVGGGWQNEMSVGLALQRAGETTAVVVSTDGDGLPEGTPAPSHAPLELTLGGGGVDLRVRALERPALVVIPAAFEEGLVADVDGTRTTLSRVDGALCGVVVPAGDHRVGIRLRGDSYPFLAALSWLTHIALAVAFAVEARSRPGSTSGRTPGSSAAETPGLRRRSARVARSARGTPEPPSAEASSAPAPGSGPRRARSPARRRR